MLIYTVVVITIVLISSIALAIILKRNNMLALRTMLAIIFSSIITIALCLVFPIFIGSLADLKFNESNSFVGIGIIWSGIISLVIFMTLIFIMTIIISSFISEKEEKIISDKLISNSIIEKVKNLYRILCGIGLGAWGKILDIIYFKKKHKNEQASETQEVQEYKDESVAASEMGEEQLLVNSELSNDINIDLTSKSNEVNEELVYLLDNIVEDELRGKNILEKFVDSEQNTDKMGVETVSVEEAFSKEDTEIDALEFEKIESQVIENPEKVNIEEDFAEKYESVNDDFEVSIDYFDEDESKDFVEVEEEIEQEKLEIVEEVVQEDDKSDVQIQDLAEEKALDSDETEEEAVEQEEVPIHSDEIAIERLEEVTGNIDVSVEEEAVELENESKNEVIEAISYEPKIEKQVVKVQEEVSVDEYVDEAFRLKESGDLEGAILYYMYALDKKPDNNLIFWIILDTCVLYKELGQSELAKEILEGYVANFGDLMDETIKSEIEKNLL